jgi:hypothetical protein
VNPPASFAARSALLINYYADARGGQPAELIELAARLHLGRWDAESDQLLGDILADPHGDMFWMIPTALVLLAGRDTLPESRAAQIRDLWRTYTPYRGDTENHWLMYHAALYVMAEHFPDGSNSGSDSGGGPSWFNGRSSQENLDDTRGYLEHWALETWEGGQSEFDSPHYLSFFLAPLALLYGFARDARVKELAHTMLTLLAADFAADQHGGLYAGAFSRVYPQPTLERWRNGSTTWAWLLFGNIPLKPDPINRVLQRVGYRPHGMAVILAMSGYTPPEAVVRLANIRTHPFEHFERHHTRRRIRYARPVEAIRKTTFMHPHYAVGSVQGGLLQPIQQHTWEILWKTPHPFDGWNVFFTLHPYSDPLEMGMYFGEEPLRMIGQLAASEKPTYDQPDKWTGGSPFERVYQHRNVVVALYDIPPGTRFPHVSGFVSRRLAVLADEASGWFVAYGDNVRIGCYPLAPFEWRDEEGGDKRMFTAHAKCGFVVVAASTDEYADPTDFLAALVASPLETSRYPVPEVRFTPPGGETIEAAFYGGLVVDGVPVDYNRWPRYGGEVMGVSDDDTIEVRHGDEKLVLHRSSLTLGE